MLSSRTRARTAMTAVAAVLLLALILLSPLRGLFAQEFPEPVGYVNDFASVFDPEIRSGFDDSLRLAEEETGVEIAVVTVPDLGGTTIEDYAVRLFEQWGIGQRDEDNGILLILAVAERQVRIEVGYGMESVITDGRAGRILDEAVLPEFRDGNFALGLLNGAYEIRLAVEDAGITAGDGGPASTSSGSDTGGYVGDYGWVLLVLAFASIYVAGFMARTKSVWLGAVWGGIVGGVVGFLVYSVVAGIIGIVGGAFVGLLLDLMLSTAYQGQRASGRSSAWHQTWGGFAGMGVGRSYGTRFGGFGGFGGGHSGGGGASRGF